MKFFGIGLSKTGTKSLADAFNILGYRFLHNPNDKQILDLPEKIIGASDIIVAKQFENLDKLYPNSKFIYTQRNKESWLVSIENHMAKKDVSELTKTAIKNRLEIYGQLNFDYNVFSEAYDRFEHRVFEYFKDRKEDLLIMNICDGDKWDVLMPFLGKEFPHANRRNK